MKETIKESYFDLETKIRALGPIKEIVNNPDAIRSIIAYDGDRHYLCVFIDAINEGLNNGTLGEEDLHYFRSGEFMDAIVHLDETIETVNPHEMQTAERLDKINYVSVFKDAKTLSVSYTHPEIIAALCGESKDSKPSDLTWWATCGTFGNLPNETQQTIEMEIFKRDNMEVLAKLMSEGKGNNKSYSEVREETYHR